MIAVLAPDPFVRTSYADVCLTCLEHRVQPAVMVRENGQADCVYSCPCGATWTCRWAVGAVEGWGAA